MNPAERIFPEVPRQKLRFASRPRTGLPWPYSGSYRACAHPLRELSGKLTTGITTFILEI